MRKIIATSSYRVESLKIVSFAVIIRRNALSKLDWKLVFISILYLYEGLQSNRSRKLWTTFFVNVTDKNMNCKSKYRWSSINAFRDKLQLHDITADGLSQSIENRLVHHYGANCFMRVLCFKISSNLVCLTTDHC